MQSPIIRQIWVFGIMTATISLILACIGFGIVEYYRIQNEAGTKISSQIKVFAYNLQPALLFDDKEAADKILSSLQEDKSIVKASVYKNDGRLFTAFGRSNKQGSLKVSRIVFYKQKPIGRVEMEAIYLGITERYITYFLVCLLIILISFPASYVISGPIRRQVSKGVIQLEQQSNRLRLLADQVAATEQRERKRIAALIHDHLQQLLVACKLQVGLTLRSLEKKDFEKASVSLKRVDEFLNESTRAARTLTVELRPPVLYEDGLGPAFRWLANKFKDEQDFEVTLYIEETPRTLQDHLKIMIFESVKEMLFNSVKYSGKRSAELMLRYKPDHIVIIVKDKGHGFDINHAERTSSDKGGFGLFSIRERIKLAGGTMKLLSYPGQGTEIEIIIPVNFAFDKFSEVTIPLEKTPEISKQPISKAIKILLADDHKIVREGIANLLKENPLFNVIAQAEDGMEALEKTELFHPDVVVMDINMPRLNGIEATRIIKKNFANIDIIGLSVQDQDGVLESMKKAGAVTLINKAGDPQDLVQAILNCRKNRKS